MKKIISGFTIVELLIVIVVIAILAAISIVAYNGIQVRAENTKTIQGVESFVKAYHMYALDNGDYPQTSGCLGEGYVSNRCLSQDGTAACFSLTSSTSTAMNTALKPYMNNIVPSVSMQQMSCGGTSYVGAYAAYQAGSKTMIVIMMLRGDQACPPMSPNAGTPGKASTGEATRCQYVLAAV